MGQGPWASAHGPMGKGPWAQLGRYGTRMERKWNADGTQVERRILRWNADRTQIRQKDSNSWTYDSPMT